MPPEPSAAVRAALDRYLRAAGAGAPTTKVLAWWSALTPDDRAELLRLASEDSPASEDGPVRKKRAG